MKKHLNVEERMKRLNFYIPLIFILILTALVYSRTLQNGFLTWDDDLHVTNNPDIQSLSLQNIKTIFTSYYVKMYHPVVTLTFAVEYHFFGLTAAVYHATNVLFHLANVVLVFFLVLLLSRRRATAVIAACLFALHPMHVESVAWITERKDVVYAFFYLSALIFYLRFIQQGNRTNYWMVSVCFILSLFSKTTAITLPLVLFLIDIYYRRKVTKQTFLEKLPLLFFSLVFGLIALRSQGDITTYVGGSSLNLIDLIFLASYSLCYYIVHLFLPLSLSALHLVPMKINGLLPAEYYLALIPLIILAFIGTRKGLFQREYVFGMLFFIAGISLSLHIVPISMVIVAERFTYMPYIGLYYIIGQVFSISIDRYKDSILPWKKGIMAGAALLALFFGYLTYQRIAVWKSTSILFQDAAMKTNNTAEANFIHMLAFEHEGAEKTSMKLYMEAVECFNKAVALNPQYPKLYFNRGVSEYYLHKYDDAMKDYDKAIELNSSFAPAYYNRAVIYLLWNRQQEACDDLWKAYRLGMHEAGNLIQPNCF
jgi:protein O-mannosyl-transferase